MEFFLTDVNNELQHQGGHRPVWQQHQHSLSHRQYLQDMLVQMIIAAYFVHPLTEVLSQQYLQVSLVECQQHHLLLSL